MPVYMGMSKTATSPEKHQVLLIEFEVLYPLHLGNVNASGFCIFFRHPGSVQARYSFHQTEILIVDALRRLPMYWV